MPRPFLKFHDRIINMEAISDVEISPDGTLSVRMVAPDAIFRLEGEEAKTLLSLLSQLWVDSRR
jgi:hypothetical protein